MSRAAVPVPLLETALIVCWSSGFIGARLAADTPSVFLVLFWRFLITGLVLAPWVVRAARHVPLRVVAVQGGIGALAMFGYLGFGVKAIDLGVPLGTAALIAALQPLTTAALVGPVLGEAVRPRQWLGLILGLFGVAAAVGGSLGAAPLWAYLLSLMGMACIVAATLLAKSPDAATLPILPTLGVQSLVSAVLFLPLAALDGPIAPLADAGFAAAVAWFILFSTIGAYGFYWLCLRRSTATRVASLIYLTPPVTALWGWAMFAEPIPALAVAGFAVCLAGVWLAGRPGQAGRAGPDAGSSGYPDGRRPSGT